MLEELSESQCVPCSSDDPPLTEVEIGHLAPQIPTWKVVDEEGIKRLERTFTLKDFAEALALTNKIGAIAEAEGHHPLIVTEWGRVRVQWWTHKMKGLHKNDFIMAARTEKLLK